MIRRLQKRFANTPTADNFRKENPPLCPSHHIPLRCERTKTEGEFKTQYRYCPICGHPEQVVSRI